MSKHYIILKKYKVKLWISKSIKEVTRESMHEKFGLQHLNLVLEKKINTNPDLSISAELF